jgi:hypothetical protein
MLLRIIQTNPIMVVVGLILAVTITIITQAGKEISEAIQARHQIPIQVTKIVAEAAIVFGIPALAAVGIQVAAVKAEAQVETVEVAEGEEVPAVAEGVVQVVVQDNNYVVPYFIYLIFRVKFLGLFSK